MKLKKRKHVATESDERLYLATWLMMDVTASIANAIAAKGLQQKDIAERLGTTSQNISQMLEGGRNLTLRSAADLAWAVDCAVRIRLQPLDDFDAQMRPAAPTPTVRSPAQRRMTTAASKRRRKQVSRPSAARR